MKAETRRYIGYGGAATLFTAILGGGLWHVYESAHQEPVHPEAVTVYVADIEKELKDKQAHPNLRITNSTSYPSDSLDVIRTRTYRTRTGTTTVKVTTREYSTTRKDNTTELFVDANIQGSSTKITYKKGTDGWEVIETVGKGTTIYKTNVMRPNEFKTLQKKTNQVVDTL